MRVLCLDAYDSYTQNLVALFNDNFQDRGHVNGKAVDEIIVIPHDICEWRELSEHLHSFDAVVVSPGPGHPNVHEDVRLAANVFATKNIPVLGVCLGMQSLVVAHGGSVSQMKQVKHGVVCQIDHCGDDLFRDIPAECYGTRYHSLHVNIAEMPPHLKALAFTSAEDDDEPCLMACRHSELPHWGVQYHPDSICSTYGREIIKNFLSMADQFNLTQNRLPVPLVDYFKDRYGSSPRPIVSATKTTKKSTLKLTTVGTDRHISINSLCQALRKRSGSSDFVLLDSAAAPGKWTYLSCVSAGMFRINYNASDQLLRDTRNPIHATATMEKTWSILKDIMEERQISSDLPSSVAPFCGGFIGWFSYEAGLKTMGLKDINFGNNVSDIALAFIERSIALDVQTNTIYVQSIAPDDEQWISETGAYINLLLEDNSNAPGIMSNEQMCPLIYPPVKEDYLNKIITAKEQMQRGNSYEICLTDQTVITLENRDPWQIYLSVRKNNPAPYALFFQLGTETLVGSSPELFLRCESGICELRPIKGTVRKTDDTSLETARRILGGEKERAENLMIVDLLRNDLYQVADIGSVRVLQLMEVEEYATVFQLVSSIVGKVSDPFTGLDVLARTLPPGSMTGAPKRRTCEILQHLENHPRGVYSGVAGYWSVNGNHLWSVVIRSAYKGSDNSAASVRTSGIESNSVWTVGAGGALLSVSSAEAEWDEMRVKADSVVRGLTPSVEFDVLESMFFDDAAEDPCPLWDRHLERLKQACAHFGYVVPHDDVIMRSIQQRKFKGQRQKVRMTIQKSGECEVTCQPLKPMAKQVQIKLDIVSTALQNFDFVRYKTTLRGHYDSARVRTETQGFDEVLLYDKEGYLMEGSFFSIALWRQTDPQVQGMWVTPPSSNCLRGIMRDKLLEEKVIVQGELHKSQLRLGETIMLFNAVRGVCWGKLASL